MRRRTSLGVVALAGALVLSSCGLVGGGGQHIGVTAYFTRTVSLYTASQVRVLGLPAGSVQEVEVEDDRVRVELRIPTDVPVPADARATIVPLSLIGERYVQLFPAYRGGPRLEDGDVIPLSRTSVPVEPDEALEAVRDLLDDLNPDATRRLTENLADDVKGQGRRVNRGLRELAAVTEQFALKSDTLGRIIDHFDEFTATLVTREDQIGQVLDDFATLTEVLAQERDHIRNIVDNLARFAEEAGDLVEEHGDSLRRDLRVLERVAMSLSVNLDSLDELLEAGAITGTGLRGAYDAENRLVRLRNDSAQGDTGADETSTAAPGVRGTPRPGADAAGPGGGGDGTRRPTVPESPFDPVDELVERLMDEGVDGVDLDAPASSGDDRSGPERVARGVTDFFGALGGAARFLVGMA